MHDVDLNRRRELIGECRPRESAIDSWLATLFTAAARSGEDPLGLADVLVFVAFRCVSRTQEASIAVSQALDRAVLASRGDPHRYSGRKSRLGGDHV